MPPTPHGGVTDLDCGDRLDSRGNPLSAFWDHETRQVEDRGRFWPYVDE